MTYNDGDSLPHSAGGPKPQIEVLAGLPFRASSSLQQWRQPSAFLSLRMPHLGLCPHMAFSLCVSLCLFSSYKDSRDHEGLS